MTTGSMEEYKKWVANKIIESISNDPRAFGLGQRNDDTVDFLLAWGYLNWDLFLTDCSEAEREAWKAIKDVIYKSVCLYNKKVEEGEITVFGYRDSSCDKRVSFEDEHFDRIWPYVEDWIDDDFLDYLVRNPCDYGCTSYAGWVNDNVNEATN